MHEALKLLHHGMAFKLVAISLTFLTVVQFPLTSMASHVEVAQDTISDPQYFYYQHGDHLGSSHVLTEGKSESRHSGIIYRKGNLLQRFEYAPFGQETFALNPNLKFDPSYTGQTYDIETGLYYYKSRYYDPKLSRFIQPDTIIPDAKNLQAYNRYSYVSNNPLKYTDPSGHSFVDWFKKLFGAFIGALVGIIVTIASAGALAPVVAGVAKATLASTMLAGAFGGLAGGVVSGAIMGGLRGALYGGLFGLAAGAVFGGANFGLEKLGVGEIGRIAIFGAVGASLSGGLGGWEGLATFAAGFVGAYLGSVIGKSIGADILQNRINAQVLREAEIEGGGELYAQAGQTRGPYSRAMSGDWAGGGGGGGGIGGGGCGARIPSGGPAGGGARGVYRQGHFPNGQGQGGNTVKAGQWAEQHPLTTTDYAKQYGLPAENSGPPQWVVKGQVEPGTYSTGSAPPSYNKPANIGGATEIRPVNPGGVQLEWFHMP